MNILEKHQAKKRRIERLKALYKKKPMKNPLDDSKDIGSYEEIRQKANRIRGKEVFPAYKSLHGL